MEKTAPQLKYASMQNEFIQAIVGEHFRLASEAQARIKLAALEQNFIRSKNRPEGLPSEAVFLWIKDFAVTEKDLNKGYKGNFAAVMFREAKGKSAGGAVKYTLFAKKYDIDLKLHPMQQRQKASHPNWGHPILRLIQKGKIYKTIAAAEKDLQLLHEEYPTTTIPLGNKLNIMVYSKKKGAGADEKPIKKHVLEIKSNPEGQLYIEVSEKAEKKKMPLKLPGKTQAQPKAFTPATQNPTAETEGMGKFTTMVQLRRNKKKK